MNQFNTLGLGENTPIATGSGGKPSEGAPGAPPNAAEKGAASEEPHTEEGPRQEPGFTGCRGPDRQGDREICVASPDRLSHSIR